MTQQTEQYELNLILLRRKALNLSNFRRFCAS